MLLLLATGHIASPTPPPTVSDNCICAFQIDAFQNDAFQVCSGVVVGWPDTLRRKVPRKHLERLLKLQKDATFGRTWFAEFEEAQQEFAAADARAAVEVAAQEAREAAELVHETIREEEFTDALRQVALTLEVTKLVKRTKDIVSAANQADAVARWIKAQIEFEDEEELVLMLLQ